MSHHVDMSNGRANMAYVGKKPWHGLGEELEEGATIEQWRKAAGMEWDAVTVPAQYESGDGETHTIPNRYVILRNDTNALLGDDVSNRYKILQPGGVLEFFRDIVEEYQFELNTAGCLMGGRLVWAMAGNADHFNLGKSDRINRNILLVTSYDKSRPTIAKQTSVRVVCWNTLTAALGKDSLPVARTKHSSTFNAAKTQELLGLDESWKRFQESCENLAASPVSASAAREYFADVLYGEQEDFNLSKAGTRVNNRLDELVGVYNSAPGQRMASAKGTAWGLVNAVTYHVDHVAKCKSADVRMDKAWFGTGEVLKNRAFEKAMAFTNN